MKYFFSLVIALSLVKFSAAQLFVGGGYGSFHVRGESDRVKGSGPTLKINYVGEEENQQVFLDVSVYKKGFDAGETQITDSLGSSVGYAGTRETYSITHLQLGFKRALAGDFTDSKFNFFLAAGGALSFVNVEYKYTFPGLQFDDEKVKRVLYGFHFGAGAQFRLKPVIIELRGNFDFLVKPIELGGSENNSYFLTSTRLGILVPLTKEIKRGI